jgi:hypothetical protein
MHDLLAWADTRLAGRAFSPTRFVVSLPSLRECRQTDDHSGLTNVPHRARVTSKPSSTRIRTAFATVARLTP